MDRERRRISPPEKMRYICSLFCLLMFFPATAAENLPTELQSIVNDRKLAIKRINDRSIQSLETLKKRYLQAGNVKSAVKTEKVIKEIRETESMPPVFLDDMKEFNLRVLGDHFGKHGFTRDGRLSVNGTRPTHSLFLHPPHRGQSSISYRLGIGYSRFSGRVAIADGAKLASPLTFKVLGNGKPIWTSKPLVKAGDTESFTVAIDAVMTLTLQVQCPGNADGAHAVWLEPAIR